MVYHEPTIDRVIYLPTNIGKPMPQTYHDWGWLNIAHIQMVMTFFGLGGVPHYNPAYKWMNRTYRTVFQVYN